MTANRSNPFSIRIFLPDGTADGIRIIEKSNWTGVGVVVPRAVLNDSKKREECSRTGVYVLVGQEDENELPTIYIGQGDPVRNRLEQHLAKKDFWTSAIFFVTRDDSLNKAHIGYLEARLYHRAVRSKRAKLDNSNQPNPSPLTEADTADMDSFLDDMLNIFPLLGVRVFERPQEKPRGSTLLSLKSKGLQATGYESSQGFVVLAGSTASTEETASIHSYQSALRKELKQQGILVGVGETLKFTQDYEFGSPSSAAAVLVGGAASGPQMWKDKNGRSLKEIRQLSIEEPSA